MSQYILSKINKKSSKLSITDATACIGGNTISFSKFFSDVYSIELEDFNYKILEHNVKVFKDLYKPTPKGSITTFNGNYKDIIDSIENKDVIFFDPPCTKGVHIKKILVFLN